MRRAEASEEARAQAVALNQPLSAEIAVRQDSAGAVPIDDPAHAPRDVFERLVPAHTLEALGAFRSLASQRMKHAIRAVDALEVVGHLRAQSAPGERMAVVTHQPDSGAVAYRHLPSAGVGAIVWADAAHFGIRSDGRIGHALSFE